MTTPDTDALTERIEDRLHDCMFTAVVQEPDGEMTTYVDAPLAEVMRIVEAEVRKAKAEAWDEGHSWGWSDAQDAHDVRQEMDRTDWSLNTPNPYRQENDR